MAQLPRAYALALRLRQLGADDDLIGECLEVPPGAVGPLLQVAEAKLASTRLPAEGEPSRGEGPPA